MAELVKTEIWGRAVLSYVANIAIKAVCAKRTIGRGEYDDGPD
jgi:hypothetical protein